MKALFDSLRRNQAAAKSCWTTTSETLANKSAPLESLEGARSAAAATLATLAADCAALDRERNAITLDCDEAMRTQRDHHVEYAEAQRERFQTAMRQLDSRIAVAVEERRLVGLADTGRYAERELKGIAARLEAEVPKARQALADLAREAKEAIEVFKTVLLERAANPEVEELKFKMPGGLFTAQNAIEDLRSSFCKEPPAYVSRPIIGFADPNGPAYALTKAAHNGGSAS